MALVLLVVRLLVGTAVRVALVRCVTRLPGGIARRRVVHRLPTVRLLSIVDGAALGPLVVSGRSRTARRRRIALRRGDGWWSWSTTPLPGRALLAVARRWTLLVWVVSGLARLRVALRRWAAALLAMVCERRLLTRRACTLTRWPGLDIPWHARRTGAGLIRDWARTRTAGLGIRRTSLHRRNIRTRWRARESPALLARGSFLSGWWVRGAGATVPQWPTGWAGWWLARCLVGWWARGAGAAGSRWSALSR
nr:hypothetical protein [Kibdelosporangium sp. MJ126-NF4]CEL16524.1 hypothetical protein [Kibdelosporangium sp. MJ126-NF4]CTQ90477.1 hypothetical protein [Kibdelosporangium sp. MJ126-NF4]